MADEIMAAAGDEGENDTPAAAAAAALEDNGTEKQQQQQQALLKERHRDAFNLEAFNMRRDGKAADGTELSSVSSSKVALTDAKWHERIHVLRQWNEGTEKQQIQFHNQHKAGYRWVREFTVTEICKPENNNNSKEWQLEKIMATRKHRSGTILLPISKVFDAIHLAHKEVSHGSKLYTHNRLCDKYANISRDQVRIFIEHCPVCNAVEGAEEKPLKRWAIRRLPSMDDAAAAAADTTSSDEEEEPSTRQQRGRNSRRKRRRRNMTRKSTEETLTATKTTTSHAANSNPKVSPTATESAKSHHDDLSEQSQRIDLQMKKNEMNYKLLMRRNELRQAGVPQFEIDALLPLPASVRATATVGQGGGGGDPPRGEDNDAETSIVAGTMDATGTANPEEE
jgi:hypothetical protein